MLPLGGVKLNDTSPTLGIGKKDLLQVLLKTSRTSGIGKNNSYLKHKIKSRYSSFL